MLEEGKILQYKGTRYNSFLNGMSGLCRVKKFGHRERRMYNTLIVVIELEIPKGSGEFGAATNCEENDVEFAEIGSSDFQVFHSRMIPETVRAEIKKSKEAKYGRN